MSIMFPTFYMLPILYALGSWHISPVSASLACTPESFSAVLPKNTTVTFATPVTRFGTFSSLNGVNISFSGNITRAALPICVIELHVQSSANTSFNTGVVLPNSWNGRLLATGNPGFSGGLRWSFQARSLNYGPAVTVSTDTGHVGQPNNISFAINNPEGIIDWAYRSLHESTVLAKLLAKTYYGSDVQHSYYTACSNGGRQGLKEVQMFPEDYDGVLAGAPPWQITHLHPWAVQVGLWNLPVNQSRHIESYKFPLIEKLIMAQCDAQDGVVDHIMQDPYSCKLNSSALLCNSTQAPNTCLTEGQVDTLSLMYNDWKAADGSLLFPRFPLSASASRYASVTTAPNHFGLEYMQGFVYNTTEWDWTTFKGEETVKFVDSLNTGDAGALSTDLSAFKSRGGKLIMYHGLADTTIPTGSSIDYFERVSAAMSGSVEDFYQLYLIPGMGHCGQSDTAPYYIAAAGQVVKSAAGGFGFSVPGYVDPEHDVLLAMMQWVENSTAPTHIIASKWVNDTLEDGLLAQRTICPYPQKAVFNGTADWHSATGWNCQDGELYPTQNATVGTIQAIANTTSTSSSSSPSATGDKSAAVAYSVGIEDLTRLAGWGALAIVGGTLF